jgi:hypothetical protein
MTLKRSPWALSIPFIFRRSRKLTFSTLSRKISSLTLSRAGMVWMCPVAGLRFAFLAVITAPVAYDQGNK